MNTSHEQNILTFSACGALFFAILALAWGILAKSQMIIFDGVYSFISLLLTGLYVYASKNIAKGRDEKFPFGRTQLEPMVIVVQSIVLIIICTKAFGSAINSLFSAGQEINSLSGMLYAVIGVAGCFISWYYITHASKAKSLKSELIKTLGSQWLMDTMLSFAVLIGFFISHIIQSVGYVKYARYIDPLMVTVAVLFFIREPIVSLINGIRGILIMTPEETIYSASKEAINKIADKRGFEDIILRLGRSGREFIYEISFIAKDSNSSYSISQMDAIRKEVEGSLCGLFDNPMRIYITFVDKKSL